MFRLEFLIVAAVLLAGVFSADDSATSFTTDCFNISGTISFNVTYKQSDDKLGSYEVKLTKAAKLTDHNCKKTNTTPVMAKITEGGNALTIEFDINEGTKKLASIDPKNWGVTKMMYDYKVSQADAKTQGPRQATAIGSYFVTPINHTYSCSQQSVKLENVTNGATGNDSKPYPDETVSFEETGLTVRFGPVNPNETDYDYHYCKADQKVKDIVPIAVGVALAALVVIVLVAYLIGRRRTVAAGGYERV